MLAAAIWILAFLEFLRPTDKSPSMLTKAKEKIGYAPKTLISEGLERFVAWYQAQNAPVE